MLFLNLGHNMDLVPQKIMDIISNCSITTRKNLDCRVLRYLKIFL